MDGEREDAMVLNTYTVRWQRTQRVFDLNYFVLL